MAFFGLFGDNGKLRDTGAGDAEYITNGPLNNLPEILLYDDCRNIYKYWALGKRIAKALPNFALSAQREIVFENMPPICSDYFREIERKLQIQKLVKEALVNIRIFGISGICLIVENKDLKDKVTYEDLQKNLCSFNIIDPLNLAGSQIGIDPTKVNYQKVSSIKLQGIDVDLSRCYIGFNDHLFYLDYIPSNFNFGSNSIYQNMVNIIHDWNRCVTALERISTKAGAILVRNRDGGVLNSVSIEAAKRTLETIRNMRNDGIASINNSDSVELFSLTGASEVDAIIERLNSCIMMALHDTPSAILLDEKLAQGFGEGQEDMKAILIAVDDYRETHIRPLYEFIDKYILYLAFTPRILQSLKESYSEFKGLSVSTIRELVFSSYRFEWGNLYPESEATRVDNIGRKLDNLLKLKDLGANIEDIENIINSDDALYEEEISLEEQNLEAFGENENSDDLTDENGQSDDGNETQQKETKSKPSEVSAPSKDEE